MTTTITFIIITTLISASVLTIWFGTPSAPGLLFHFLRKIGIKKKDKEFWKYPNPEIEEIDENNRIPLYDWSEDEWQMFAMRLGFLGSLLTCRYCVGAHVIFWINILAFIIGLIFTDISISFFPIALLATLIEPVIVQILVGHAIKH